MEQWKNKGLFAKTIYSLNGLRTAFLTEKAIRHESLGVVVAVSLALFMERGWSDRRADKHGGREDHRHALRPRLP